MATIGTLTVSLQARTTDLERGLNRAQAQVQRFSRAITALPTAFAGLAAVSGLAQVVQTIAGFEQRLSDVRAVTQATEAQMKQLTAEARRLGATTQFSAAQAAEGIALLGQAGFSTEQILAAMGDTLNLAAAGSLELAQAAEIVSNVLSTFNLNARESGRVADVLAAAANISNTNVQQLGEALSYAGPIAANLGHSLEATAAALAVLSNRGIQASRAGEGLRRVLGTLAAPTKEVQDTLAGLQRIFPELELSLDKLNPQTNSTADIFARLAPLLTDTRLAFKLFGVEGAAIAAILAQTTAQQRQYEQQVQSAGQASETARIRVDNLTGDYKELQSALEEVQHQLGDAGLGAASREAVQALTQIIRENRQLIDTLGRVAAAATTMAATIAREFSAALATAKEFSQFFLFLSGARFGTSVTGIYERLLQGQDQAVARARALADAAEARLAQQRAGANRPAAPAPSVPQVDVAGRQSAVDALLAAESAGKGTVATVASVTKQIQELHANLAALPRQTAMLGASFDEAAERAKLLESGAREITQTLARQPELLAQLPPPIREAAEGLGAQLRSAQQVVEVQEQAREVARQAAQEEAQRAQQATELVRQLGIEAQFLQQQLALQKLQTGEQDARTALLEFEQRLQEQNLTLRAQQRQEAERHLATISATRQELDAIQARQADTQRRGEVQRRTLTDLAQEINLTTQLLSIQGLSDQQREMRTQLLVREAELIANGVEVTAQLRAGLEQLITTQVHANAALERAAFFRDLTKDTADLQALVAAQRLSRREREIELALIQEKRRLNQALAPEAEAALRQQLALQRDLNEELNRPRPLRDFAESTQEFWTGIEEGAVRALEGLEDTLVRFATTGSFRTDEQRQTLQELNDLSRERKALTQEIAQLEGLPGGQLPAEALRQQEQLNQLQRELEILDERKKVLDETVKSQSALNKLFDEFFNQLLQASVRTLFTGPLANAASGTTPGLAQGGAQGSQITTLITQGLGLLSGLFGGGGASFTGVTSTLGGINEAAIISHTGGLIGRDLLPRVQVPAAAFATAPRFQFGGMVSRGGDNVPAILQTGERVLSRSETTRLARLEAIAGQMRAQGQEHQAAPITVINQFPNVTTKQDADAIRRSTGQIEQRISASIERTRARNNAPHTAR